jgi:ATP-dependent helicase HrpB
VKPAAGGAQESLRTPLFVDRARLAAVIPDLPDLPIRAALPELRRALGAGHVVLCAPPGSGKTTVVPLALLDEPWLAGRRILMLEPRRLAARASAARIAELAGTEVGDLVGYQVRFERRISAVTRIEVLTEGVLTRRLQSDPELEGVGLLVFDEFHERSIHADLALALALDVVRSLRPDLRVLVMSATLDAGPVAALLGGANVVRAEGRQYPVEVRYLARPPSSPLLASVERTVRRVLAQEAGDVLVFLPGGAEIRGLLDRLRDGLPAGCVAVPLYGDLPKEAQDLAIRPRADGRRRVVAATDIAETSLTIEGVTVVVDSGLRRESRFDPNRGLNRLETARISRDSADQRAGRAGRLGPGVCHRLWTEAQHRELAERRRPEILSADLAPLALELLRWGVAEPGAIAWLDAPPPAHWAQAVGLLVELGLVDDAGRLTTAGHRAVGLGTHPRLAHLLHAAAAEGCASLGADLAALLEERDPFRPRPGEARHADIELRLDALERWRAARRADSGTDPHALGRAERAARHWRTALGTAAGRPCAASAGALLSLAFPDRIGRRRGAGGSRYLLASGRGAALEESDPLTRAELLVAADLEAGRADGRVFLAAAVGPDELRRLHRERIQWCERLEWDAGREAVVASREERLGALTLSVAPADRPDRQQLLAALCDGLRRAGIEALPWTEHARQLRARVAFLARHDPGGGWPDLSDAALAETLEDWLGPWAVGLRSLAEIRGLDLAGIMEARLDWASRQRLAHLAPDAIRVPSGSMKRLDYTAGDPPVLAVKLQEMFGLADTPRLCEGRVPVMLHLLSPAQRPVQVTQDLRGFWERTYPEVRRELRGRYPRHPWPDDPWGAPPTARAKPRP